MRARVAKHRSAHVTIQGALQRATRSFRLGTSSVANQWSVEPKSMPFHGSRTYCLGVPAYARTLRRRFACESLCVRAPYSAAGYGRAFSGTPPPPPLGSEEGWEPTPYPSGNQHQPGTADGLRDGAKGHELPTNSATKAEGKRLARPNRAF